MGDTFDINDINESWKAIEYGRGDIVKYSGSDFYRPLEKTYVWAVLRHLTLELYLIEHPDGEITKETLRHNGGHFRDGFENFHSSEVKEGLKYIQVFSQTLTLIKSADQ